MNRMAIHMSCKLHFVQYQYRVIIITLAYCKEVHSSCQDGMSFVRKTTMPFEIYSHLRISSFPAQYLARIKVHLNFHFK